MDQKNCEECGSEIVVVENGNVKTGQFTTTYQVSGYVENTAPFTKDGKQKTYKIYECPNYRVTKKNFWGVDKEYVDSRHYQHIQIFR